MATAKNKKGYSYRQRQSIQSITNISTNKMRCHARPSNSDCGINIVYMGEWYLSKIPFYTEISQNLAQKKSLLYAAFVHMHWTSKRRHNTTSVYDFGWRASVPQTEDMWRVTQHGLHWAWCFEDTYSRPGLCPGSWHIKDLTQYHHNQDSSLHCLCLFAPNEKQQRHNATTQRENLDSMPALHKPETHDV